MSRIKRNDCRVSMDKNALFEKINQGVLEERYHIFKRNLCKNLEFIRKFGGLQRIVPYLKNKNVIIIGAGPSIDSGIISLKKYQYREDIVIISTDMSLLPLLRKGIYPAFVISCETTPVDFFSSAATEKMHLLAFSCMSNSNLRKWKGDISFYNWMIHNSMYDELWSKSGDLGSVATGSVVTTQAVSLALGCGINSLMLAGNDLGFRREYYAKETVVYRNNLIRNNRLCSLETFDANITWQKREYEIKRDKRISFTNNQFLSAKLWLEELFKDVKIPVYDASDPGCSEGSVLKVSIREYSKIYES